MREFIRLRAQSFRYAFAGWWFVIRTQKNAWIHAMISVIVVVVAVGLQLSPTEWAILILTIGMVWIAEFLNTALEAVIDLVSPQQNPLAKVGKDVGAAAVLIAALSSIIIGLLIMGPRLWTFIQGWIDSSP